MLACEEYAAIKADYDAISRAYFARNYFAPEGMSFARSDALFPPPELEETVGREYMAQCNQLCFGAFPSWKEVQARFLDMRALL